MSNRDEIPGKIGYCPQTDILFSNLTVDQHLEMVCRIKNVSGRHSELLKVKEMTQLQQFSDQPASTLSGGNKRKLCLAMALIGSPPVLFLDEPSSGLDPVSRKEFWEVLKSLKARHRAIILTTHHLDEAEELSDRVGIMCSGSLLVVGSPNYVNKIFGEGYTLSLSISEQEAEKKEENEELEVEMKKKGTLKEIKESLHELITSIIPRAKKNPQTSETQCVYILPFEHKGTFEELFKKLEQDFPFVGVSIKNVTLEDTFVAIGTNEKAFLQKHNLPDPTNGKDIGDLPERESDETMIEMDSVAVDLDSLDSFFLLSTFLFHFHFA